MGEAPHGILFVNAKERLSESVVKAKRSPWDCAAVRASDVEIALQQADRLADRVMSLKTALERWSKSRCRCDKRLGIGICDTCFALKALEPG